MPAAERLSRGFTLVELVVTMLVISVAVLAIGQALSFAFARQSDGLWQAKAVALAQSYVEEIKARRYDEAAPVGGVPPCAPAALPPAAPCSAMGADGETRSQFDDVDDYHGLDEQPPMDAEGNPRSEYARYRVQVSVAYVDAGQIAALGLDDATDAKLITVDVTPPGEAVMSFRLLRANY